MTCQSGKRHLEILVRKRSNQASFLELPFGRPDFKRAWYVPSQRENATHQLVSPVGARLEHSRATAVDDRDAVLATVGRGFFRRWLRQRSSCSRRFVLVRADLCDRSRQLSRRR